jgi:hypothetical protein
MLCFWVFDSGSWIGTTQVFLALFQIALVRTVLALQGSAQVLRLPSLELRQNAPVHTVLAYGGFWIIFLSTIANCTSTYYDELSQSRYESRLKMGDNLYNW